MHIVLNKGFYKTWTFDCSSHNIDVKWSMKPCIVQTETVRKTLRHKLVMWILKHSNMRESPIARDTFLITSTEYGVKLIVPKILLECSL